MKWTTTFVTLFCSLFVCLPSAGATPRHATAPQAIASSSDKLTAALAAAEKEFWEAWKNKQPDRFANAMADDAVFFGTYGVAGKSELLSEQRDSVKSCVVKSYTLTNLRSIRIDANSAILFYDAEQRATCGDQPVHPFMHGESVYARRHGRWLNILRSEVPAVNSQQPQ